MAGKQFYNHEMYGSLRKGGAVDLLSMECLGLMAAIFTPMLSYQALVVQAQLMYNTQLGLVSSQIVAVERLIQMPVAPSFLVGLLFDCYPIMGLRRKGYMIFGCIFNAVAVFRIAGVSASLGADSTSNSMVILVLVLVALYSQRDRGAIPASYLIFRRFVFIFTSVLLFLALATGSEPSPSIRDLQYEKLGSGICYEVADEQVKKA
ncbi:hypothetical protein PHYSODRAFT_340154 [Phytophthora sojae]|uniref:Uncharacterized protein n=1 Tax=Phytophthora sojae (strain P6497) TaxID=1094619 RepID=G5A8Z0_PHYSP|nr:hypothetical protein PHYSODRAFT_340154 [Phytophthora sojae]EGZ08366.1 hypothetical protein PHYSODRAFT_340154 [Phytophthora sojae]|eukprot:XP_009536538.1 hypothetical protein PHYSODRAFT_340154 [Phytophthora sojae]